MSTEKKCKDLIKENYESRNELMEKLIMLNNGRFDEQVEDEVDRFVEEYTKTYGEEPSDEAVDKFREELIKNEEYNEESLYELPLGMSKYTVFKIELSTGGPADFIKAYVDDEGIIDRVTYHYQDWFDGAEMEVDENSHMWEFVEIYLSVHTELTPYGRT